MTVAVRYYSRGGNTREVAEGIAKAAGTTAVSVDAADSVLDQPVDVLFVGGALYAYGLDKNLSSWLDQLDSSKVGKAVLFSTAWISKHALALMRSALAAKGVTVETDELFLRSSQVAKSTDRIAEFARKHV